MAPLNVLILEDEVFLALDLESVILETVPASVTIAASIAQAREILESPIDVAFLDIELTDGKSFEIAAELARRDVRFVFVSASSPSHVPEELRIQPFLSKPVQPGAIVAFLQNVVSAQKGG